MIAIQTYIHSADGTVIDPTECEWVEIEVAEDESFDDTEERLNDGEGDRFEVVKGKFIPVDEESPGG